MGTQRMIRTFLLTWFSFAFFFGSTMPFLLDVPASRLWGRGTIAGLCVASVTVLIEAFRARRAQRSRAVHHSAMPHDVAR